MRNVKLLFENKFGKLHVFAKLLIVLGGVVLFQHSIIAQPPPGGNEIDLPKEHDDGGGEGTGQPGECEIWKLTQQINWTPPSITTLSNVVVGEEGSSLASQVSTFISGPIINKMKIYVTDYFLFDISLTLNECEIILAPGAKIGVLGGVEVKLENSYIHGEYNLWGEFEVHPAAILRVNDSYIQDGYIAFRARSGSVLEVENCKFNKNFVSVMGDHDNSAFSMPSVITGVNHFNCNGNLLPAVLTEHYFPFTPDNKSYAAIYSNGTVIKAFHYDCVFSSIRNHANGILAFGGAVSTQNVMFNNINRSNIYNYPYEGYGIAINLDQEAFQTSYRYDFMNTYGWAPGSGIDDYNFRNVDFPLSMIDGYMHARFHYTYDSKTSFKGVRLHWLEAVTNELNYDEKGLYLTNSNFTRFSNGKYPNGAIEYIEFNGGPQSTGVFSSRNRGDTSDDGLNFYNFDIYGNTFRGRGNGILSMGDVTLKISTNDYKTTGPIAKGTYGIQVSGGFDVNTSKNMITFGDAPKKVGLGIIYLKMEDSFVTCNEVKYGDIGFDWRGVSELQIGTNIARENYLGWHYEAGSSTSPQKHMHNRWFPINPDNDVKVEHKGDTFYNPYAIEKSIITVGSNTNSYPPEWHPGYPVNSIPFELVEQRKVYNPKSNCPDETSPLIFNEADSLIAIGEMNSSPLSTQWYQALDLYRKIKDNNLSYGVGSVYDIFVQDCESNSISAYYNAIKDFNLAFEFSPQAAYLINYYREEVLNYLGLISKADSLYYAGDLDFEDLAIYRKNQLEALQTAQSQLEDQMDSYIQTRNGKLSAAISTFQSLSDVNHVAAEYKNAYSIYARYYLDQMTAADTTKVFSFNGACVEEYHGAALVYHIISEALGSVNELGYGCEPPMIRSAEKEGNMRLYPNPVIDYTTLAFDSPYSGDINVYDMQGNLQQSVRLKEETEIQLDLTLLPSGSYIIVPDNTLYQSVKLIKQ